MSNNIIKKLTLIFTVLAIPIYGADAQDSLELRRQADWDLFYVDGAGSAYFFSPKNMLSAGGLVDVWVLEDARRNSTKRYAMRRTKHTIYCHQKTIVTLFFADYDSNDIETYSRIFSPREIEIKPIAPTSVDAILARTVCEEFASR